jgi:hypothetical protein
MNTMGQHMHARLQQPIIAQVHHQTSSPFENRSATQARTALYSKLAHKHSNQQIIDSHTIDGYANDYVTQLTVTVSTSETDLSSASTWYNLTITTLMLCICIQIAHVFNIH